MIVAVLRTNSGKCPYWDVDVCVQGMYGEREDGSWSFLRAECPIIKNSKLPIYEQDDEYKYMKCADQYSCPLYTQFQRSITSAI